MLLQARAPNSPVIIVGTHYDKLSGRASRRELDRSLAYIRDQYGHVDNVKKDGFPQVRVPSSVVAICYCCCCCCLCVVVVVVVYCLDYDQHSGELY